VWGEGLGTGAATPARPAAQCRGQLRGRRGFGGCHRQLSGRVPDPRRGLARSLGGDDQNSSAICSGLTFEPGPHSPRAGRGCPASSSPPARPGRAAAWRAGGGAGAAGSAGDPGSTRGPTNRPSHLHPSLLQQPWPSETRALPPKPATPRSQWRSRQRGDPTWTRWASRPWTATCRGCPTSSSRSST